MLSDGPLMRLLECLGARTGQAIILAVRNQMWAQYIHVVQATSAVRLFVVKGAKRPLARSASGLMLLADMPDNEIKKIGTRYNAEVSGKGTAVNISSLMDQVAEARRNGYVFSNALVTAGAGMIAMPLPQMNCDERFVIGIGGPITELTARKDEFILAMHEEIAHHFARAAGPVQLVLDQAAVN
jgi:DNA-binding IclR family transcriptional regulator